MDKDLVLVRIKQIEMEIESIKGRYFALEGRLEESKHWISVFENSEKEKKDKLDLIESGERVQDAVMD